MRSPELIIKRPLLTEKGTHLKETGGNVPGALAPEDIKAQLLFEVAKDANKVEIRYAVEKLWNVNVVSVRMGRGYAKTQNWKKAVVTIAPGQNIEFFEGV